MLSNIFSQLLFFRPKGRLTNYILSFIAVLSTTLLQVLLLGVNTSHANVLLFYYMAIFASTLAGGLYSGLSAIVLSLVFILIRSFFTSQDITVEIEFETMVYIVLCFMTSWVVAAVKNAYQISLTILNNLHSFITILSTNGNVVDVNQTALVQFGLDRDKIIGRPLMRLPLWKPSPKVDRQLQKAITDAARGVSSRFDCKFVALDDSYTFYSDLSVSPLFDRQGNVLYIILSGSDITARVHAETEQLKLSQKLQQKYTELQALFDLLPVGIGITNDRYGRDIRINSSFARMLGIPITSNASLTAPGEDRPSNFKVFRDGKLLSGHDLPMQVASRTGRTIKDYQVDIVRDDGVKLKLLEYARPLKNSRGRITGSVGAFVDISRLSDVEDALQESQRRFEALLNSNIIGVFVSTLDGKITEANEAFCNLIGYSRTEVENGLVNLPDLTPSTYHSKDAKALVELQKRGECTPYEKEYLRRDGTSVPVLIGTAMVDADEGLTISFVLDITARIRLEKRKDEFIGLASHELKTPLTSIKVFTQLLERSLQAAGPSNNLAYVQRMNAQLTRLTSLVEELLDVSKIEAGKLILQFETFDFNQLLSDTVAEVAAISQDHRFEVSGQISGQMVADPYRLKQVLINLFTNAVKYSPDADKVQVRLSEAKDQVKIEVQDFGVGIPPIDQLRIFEKFVRARGKNLHSFPGLGLGLYISKQIIERHNGKIRVVSIQEIGSTFTVELPKTQKT